MRLALVLLLVLAGTAACSSTPAAPAPSAGTSLTISVDPGKGGTPVEWTLTCDPPGGSHPDPSAACAALTGADPFAPVPTDRVCAQVFGGPQTATVTGTWQGKPVNATFSRTDGCQTQRWDALVPLLPAAQ